MTAIDAALPAIRRTAPAAKEPTPPPPTCEARSTRSGLIVAAALAALVAGCTTSSDGTSPDDSTPAGTSGATADPDPVPTTAAESPPAATVADGPPIVDGVANSLVLVHDRGAGADALASYRADGTAVARYSTGSGGLIWQPIWSPDGRRVAWTQSTDGATWELVTAAVDGSERTTHPLPGQPDYITYDPTASRVLALTPSTDGFGLVIVDDESPDDESPDDESPDDESPDIESPDDESPDDESPDIESPDGGDIPAFSLIDLGAPYFSDFSPTGDRVIAHVGADLRVVGLDGERRPLEFTSVRHQTPAWHPAGEVVIFATDDTDPADASDPAGGNRLVSHELATGVTTELAAFDAFVFFDLDPTGERVAVSAFEVEGDGGLLALRSTAPGQTPAPLLAGGLWIVDVAEGAPRQLDVRSTAPPMWDPTGSRVLARTSIAGPGQWTVYELDGTLTATDEFEIDDSLLRLYLPFWDQYVRSQTLWSPDGGRFVHVGRDADGTSGIWIHDAATTGPSTFLVGGDLAFWSPT